MPSTFEDLSDDILMDIFDALHPPVYIYHSFYNLNHRLNGIIRDSRLLVSLDLTHLGNPSNFAYHCQIMLPNMFKQLISLRLSNEPKLYEQMNIFLQHLHLRCFQSLRQLSLIQISFDQLRRMLADILSLKTLRRLHIDMFDGSGISLNELHSISNRLIGQSSSIKSMHLRFNREMILSEPVSSSLVHLHLDACYASDVPQLLTLCSDLQSLSIKVEQTRRRHPFSNLSNIDQKRLNLSSSLVCSYLTHFTVDINDLTLADVKEYLSRMPYLTHLRLEGLTYDSDFCKADLWQTILENQTKKLKQFDLKGLRIWLGNHADIDEEFLDLINQVSKSFGPGNAYWGRQWSVVQTHKLRPNHLNLTVHAKAL